MEREFKLKCVKDVVSKGGKREGTRRFTEGETYKVKVDGRNWRTVDDEGNRHLIKEEGVNDTWYKEYFEHI